MVRNCYSYVLRPGAKIEMGGKCGTNDEQEIESHFSWKTERKITGESELQTKIILK
jgi:hypothetical protein